MTDTIPAAPVIPDRLEQIARVLVAKNGTVVQGRQQINLIEGTYVTLTVTDTATSERVDVTFDVGTSAITELIQDVVGALTGFGGSGLTFSYNDGAGTVTLDVNVGTGIEVSSDALRISTAAAGYGLTGGGGAALDVDLGMVDTTPTGDQTIPADYAAYVPGGLGYTIPSGYGLTIESGGALELGPLGTGPRTWQVIDEQTLGATGPLTFANIPQTYTHLEIRGTTRGNGAATNLSMRFNGDAGTNYAYEVIQINAAVASSFENSAQPQALSGLSAGSDSLANVASPFRIFIPNYRNTSFHKTAETFVSVYDTAIPNKRTSIGGTRWASTAAVQAVNLGFNTDFSTPFLTGSTATLMGI